MVDAGESKLMMSTRGSLIRSYLAGASVALVVAFAVTVTVNSGDALVGALLHPVVFCLLYLLKLLSFEHSIVNRYLFPSGLTLGGRFTFRDHMLWNEIPAVRGNLVGGLTFVGATLYSTHDKQAPKRLA